MTLRPTGERLECVSLVLLFSAGFFETELLHPGPLTLSTTEVLILLFVAVVLGRRVLVAVRTRSRPAILAGGAVTAALALFATSCLASALLAATYRGLALKYALRVAASIFLFIALAQSLRDPARRLLAFRTLGVTTAVVAAVAVVEHFHFPAVEWLVRPFRSNLFVGTPPPAFFSSGVIREGDGVIIRSSSVFLHANALGYFLAMATMLVLSTLRVRPGRRLAAVGAAVLLLAWYALTLTYSRGAFLALMLPGTLVGGVALVRLAGDRPKLSGRRRAVVLVALLLVVLTVASNRHFVKGVAGIVPPSIARVVVSRVTGTQPEAVPMPSDLREPAYSSRLALWKAALRMGRAHPWLGIGPDNFRLRFPEFVERMDSDLRINRGIHRAHNLFLGVLAEQGVLGLGALLLLLGAVFRDVVRGLRRAGVGAETLGLLGALGAFLVGNLFDTIFYFHVYTILSYAIFASWAALSHPGSGSA